MKRYLLILIVAFILGSLNVFACDCAPVGSPTEELNRAYAVFSGKVIDISKVVYEKDPSSYDYKISFEVEKYWKGIYDKYIKIQTSGDSVGSCGYTFEQGKKYLVYAHKNSNSDLVTSVCGRTNVLESAQEDLKQLGEGEVIPPEQTKNLNSIIIWTDKSSYNKGEKIQFTAKVVDEDGTAFTPEEGAQVVLNLIDPSGVSEKSNLRYNSANGYYEISAIIPQTEESGTWSVYATVSLKGQVIATSEKIKFEVAKSETEIISEQVACYFKGSTSTQKCYSGGSIDTLVACAGVDNCVVKIQGVKGEKITWKSSCGGYAYTQIDGDDETVTFYCEAPKCHPGCTCDKEGNIVSCQTTLQSCPEGCSCYEGKVFECAIDKAPCPKDCKCDTHGVVLYCGKQQCVDSDGGKNYYEKGLVTATMSGKTPDICAAVGKSPDKLDYYRNLLHEAYCYDDLSHAYADYQCPNGCEDGACIPFIKEEDELKTDYEKEETSSKGCPERKCEGISKECLGNDLIVVEECTFYIKSNNNCEHITNTNSRILKGQCYNEEKEQIVTLCQGCQLDESTCIPFGTRLEKKDSAHYCDITKKMELQKSNKVSCQNSYECLSNNCKSGKCAPICEGCLNEDKACVPVGTRTNTQYCDSDYSFKNQSSEESSCNNNYECSSNLCVNNKCISPSLLQKIIDWFKKLFG